MKFFQLKLDFLFLSIEIFFFYFFIFSSKKVFHNSRLEVFPMRIKITNRSLPTTHLSKACENRESQARTANTKEQHKNNNNNNNRLENLGRQKEENRCWLIIRFPEKHMRFAVVECSLCKSSKRSCCEWVQCCVWCALHDRPPPPSVNTGMYPIKIKFRDGKKIAT